MMFRPIRGTHDLFGLEIEKYNIVKSEISKIAKIYNFNEIETPIFESTNLFSKPLGDAKRCCFKRNVYFFR